MSSNEFQVGKVYRVTVHGEQDVLAFYCDVPGMFPWWTARTIEGRMGRGWSEVTDVRPLVVLDLDAVLDRMHSAGWSKDKTTADVIRVLSHNPVGEFIRDQIAAQITPPRIEEPGLWGVVEAWMKDQRFRRTFLRELGEDPPACSWAPSLGNRRYSWDDLIDPTLVRPGIEGQA